MDLYARYGHSDGPDDISLEQRVAALEQWIERMAQGQTDLQQQVDILKTNVATLVQHQQDSLDRLVAAHDAANDAAFADEANQLREINSQLSNFGTQVQPATTGGTTQPAPAASGIGPTSTPLPGTAGPSRDQLNAGEAPAPAQPGPTDQPRAPSSEPL